MNLCDVLRYSKVCSGSNVTNGLGIEQHWTWGKEITPIIVVMCMCWWARLLLCQLGFSKLGNFILRFNCYKCACCGMWVSPGEARSLSCGSCFIRHAICLCMLLNIVNVCALAWGYLMAIHDHYRVRYAMICIICV